MSLAAAPIISRRLSRRLISSAASIAEGCLSRSWVKALLFVAVFLAAWLGGIRTAHAAAVSPVASAAERLPG